MYNFRTVSKTKTMNYCLPFEFSSLIKKADHFFLSKTNFFCNPLCYSNFSFHFLTLMFLFTPLFISSPPSHSTFSRLSLYFLIDFFLFFHFTLSSFSLHILPRLFLFTFYLYFLSLLSLYFLTLHTPLSHSTSLSTFSFFSLLLSCKFSLQFLTSHPSLSHSTLLPHYFTLFSPLFSHFTFSI